MNTTTTAHTCDQRTDGAGSVYYTSREACPGCLPAPTPATRTFDAMEERADWRGYGYLGERLNHRGNGLEQGRPEALTELQIAIVDEHAARLAAEAGLTDQELFDWANSKLGRWFGEMTLNHAGTGRLHEMLERARIAGTTPRRIES